MKAVVWSDTIQIILMLVSMGVLVIKGVVDVGIENVWERNLNSGRLEFFKWVVLNVLRSGKHIFYRFIILTNSV